MDEIDLLLHPLKSELNWPIGLKENLDFTRNESADGLRYKIPFHLLDAFFFHTGDSKLSGTPFAQSREAAVILQRLQAVIEIGRRDKLLQTTPHLVLLSRGFYHRQIKPLLAEWMLLWLLAQRMRGVLNEHIMLYLLKGGTVQAGDKQHRDAVKLITARLREEYIKMLNLCYDWYFSFLFSFYLLFSSLVIMIL